LLIFTNFIGTSYGSSINARLSSKVGDYTITVNDYCVEATTANSTITLRTAVGITGQLFVIDNNSGGSVTVATLNSETISGGGVSATSIVLLNQEVLEVQSNGTGYRIR
jgi:hypothetical protein